MHKNIKKNSYEFQLRTKISALSKLKANKHTHTPLPCSCTLGRSLSSATILPLLMTRCVSVVYGGPGSAPSNRYGWLQHFRSCIRIFKSRILSIFPAEFRMSISFIRIRVYLVVNQGKKTLCTSVICIIPAS